MSAARIEQLKSLLSRVQERRAAPRLRAAGAPAAVPAAVRTPAEHVAAGVAKTIPDLRQVTADAPEPLVLEDLVTKAPERDRATTPPSLAPVPQPLVPVPAAAQPLPTGSAPRPAANARSTAQTLNDLQQVAQSTAAVVAPAPKVQEPELDLGPAVETLIGTPEPVFEREVTTEVPLTAPSARVEAPLLARTEAVMKVVSSPRIEAPKTFGDLLEASLSLRPR